MLSATIKNSRIIHERSIIIPTKKNSFTSMKNFSPTSEYSLKQNTFDPSKSSPPNDFMLKLQTRLAKYNLDNTFEIQHNRDDSCDKEY